MNPDIDQLAQVLTFESHIAGVTVELFVSYSDFSSGLRSTEVSLAVNTLRSSGGERVKGCFHC